MIRRLALAVVLSLAVASPTGASAATKAPEPTLTLVRDCEFGYNTVDVILTGFPPFTTFEGTLQFDGAGIGPVQLTTDANGTFNSHTVGHVGNLEPTTFTAIIVWEGGTLTESLFVDCTKPATKEDCKNGGWRGFPELKNQGQCIAFVKRLDG